MAKPLGLIRTGAFHASAGTSAVLILSMKASVPSSSLALLQDFGHRLPIVGLYFRARWAREIPTLSGPNVPHGAPAELLVIRSPPGMI